MTGTWQDVLYYANNSGAKQEKGSYLAADKKRPSGVFACPSSVTSTENEALVRHYGINHRITPDCPDNQGGYALSKIRNASGRAMLFDIYRSGSSPNGSRAPYSPAAQNRAEMVDNGKNGTWRHKGGSGGNICFVDGHVEQGRFLVQRQLRRFSAGPELEIRPDPDSIIRRYPATLRYGAEE